MNKNKKHFLSLFLLTVLLPSCQNLSTVDKNISNKTSEIKSNLNQKNIIKGKVEFPESQNSLYKGGLNTKATVAELSSYSTVSILNPPNHSTAPNKTISTSLTDNTGIFTIYTDTSFAPAVNDVFILDASKRIGSSGKDLITLSTYIKYTGTGWQSISTPDIRINTKTTALTIITDSQPADISPISTISTMSTATGDTVPTTINAQITAQLINDLSSLVDAAIAKNADPISYVKYEYNTYSLDNPDIININ